MLSSVERSVSAINLRTRQKLPRHTRASAPVDDLRVRSVNGDFVAGVPAKMIRLAGCVADQREVDAEPDVGPFRQEPQRLRCAGPIGLFVDIGTEVYFSNLALPASLNVQRSRTR